MRTSQVEWSPNLVLFSRQSTLDCGVLMRSGALVLV